MDCPKCGLANPPGTLSCDCGYDFKPAGPAETLAWRINLAWRQKLAAFWSISWPGLVVSFLMAGPTLRWSRGFGGRVPVTALAANLVFFAIQWFLVRRLVRKKYRSFRVGVLREDGQNPRGLSAREISLVWLWMLGPQSALLLASSLIAWCYGSQLSAETVRTISSLSLWLRFLVVGPYAIGLGIGAAYPGFRLQAYGYR